jgi:hypothetical protein
MFDQRPGRQQNAHHRDYCRLVGNCHCDEAMDLSILCVHEENHDQSTRPSSSHAHSNHEVKVVVFDNLSLSLVGSHLALVRNLDNHPDLDHLFFVACHDASLSHHLVLVSTHCSCDVAGHGNPKEEATAQVGKPGCDPHRGGVQVLEVAHFDLVRGSVVVRFARREQVFWLRLRCLRRSVRPLEGLARAARLLGPDAHGA